MKFFLISSAVYPAERDVHHRALVGHQRRQGLDLVLVDLRGIADAALDGQPVLAMLHSPCRDHFVAALGPDRELDGVHAVAALDLLQQAPGTVGKGRRLLEVEVDGLEERRRRLG